MTKLETLFDNWWSIQFGGAARSGTTWRVASEAFEAGFKAARAVEPGGVIPAAFNRKPVPYELGVTYYSCQHYPPDALRRYPCDQGCK